MRDYAPLINAACQRNLMFMGLALVSAVIQHESGGNPLAVGDGGLALGLMQVHRDAAADVNLGEEWDQLDAAIKAGDADTAARLSIDIGVAYLQSMVRQFRGSEPWALAAYNQGPGVIGKAKAYADAVLILKAQG